jgi:hypothetical protein
MKNRENLIPMKTLVSKTSGEWDVYMDESFAVSNGEDRIYLDIVFSKKESEDEVLCYEYMIEKDLEFSHFFAVSDDAHEAMSVLGVSCPEIKNCLIEEELVKLFEKYREKLQES